MFTPLALPVEAKRRFIRLWRVPPLGVEAKRRFIRLWRVPPLGVEDAAERCPACPVAPEDGTGVAPEDGTGVAPEDGTGVGSENRTGVKFTLVTACQVKFMTMTEKRI